MADAAGSPDVMGRVLGIVYRTIATHLIKKSGFTKKTAQTGAVTLIQRFGSALNLNIHFIVTGPASLPAPDNEDEDAGQTREPKPTALMSWMQRLRRVFDIDLRNCPRCGGPVRVIAVITEPALIARILEHRDGFDDFRGKVPAGGARDPPAVSLH